MFIKGVYSGDKTYRHTFLANGILGILEYPNLHKKLGHFKNFEESVYDQNIFLNLAFESTFSGGEQEHKSICKKKLLDLDIFLDSAEFNSLKCKKRKNIIKHMCSFGKQNEIVYNELLLWNNFSKNTNVESVGYEDKNNDFTLKMAGNEINLEFTMLGENEKLQKLKVAFGASAIEISKHLPLNKLVKLTVNPLNLKAFLTGDIAEMIKQITKEFEAIKPLLLINTGHISTKYIGSNPRRLLSELIELFDETNLSHRDSELIKRLQNLARTSDGMAYLESTNTEFFENLCIETVFVLDTKYKYVEIVSKCVWPSTWSEKLLDLVKNQLYSRIKTKLEEKQLAGRKNPFILIKFDFFLFHGYTKNDIWAIELLEFIRSLVLDVFRNCDEKEIQGILFFEDDLKNLLLIKNPNCAVSSEIITCLNKIAKIKELDITN